MQAAITRPWYTRTFWEIDQRCPRARYWLTEYRGRGIESNRPAFELSMGTIVHAGIAAMLTDETTTIHELVPMALRDLEPAVAEMPEEIQAGHRAILEGLLRGFDRAVRPTIRREYDVLFVEQEVAYPHNGVTLASKPDTILRHRESGDCVYVEWKTTRSTDARWLKSWHRHPQLIAGALGAAEQLGVVIDHAYVVGLYKGYEYKGQLNSPWISAWRKLSPISGWEYSPDRPQSWKGWEKFLVADLEGGGLEQWVRVMPYERLQGYFIWTDPITCDPELTAAWLRQSAWREYEIAEARREATIVANAPPAIDRVFPQNFLACEPPWGHVCPYLEACWLRHVQQDPVGSGAYRWREPHHQQEPIRWAPIATTGDDDATVS